jgi:CubicO group peptidase (beta-lactamase class C family)
MSQLVLARASLPRRRHVTRGPALLLCALLGWGCAGDDDGKGDDAADDAADDGADDSADDGADDDGAGEFAELDEVIDGFLEDRGLEGAGVVVVDRDDGEVYVAGYGDFDADRLYMIASSSKILSVGVLMRLADLGMLDIDEPIGTYLAEPFGEGKPELTLAQLVSNSSGLLGLVDNPTYAPYLCQYISAGTLSECAEQIYVAADEAERVEPDTAFRYGGAQWQLAGGVAEVVSGLSWPELIDETYIQPCGADTLGYGNEFQTSGLEYPAYFEGDVANLTETENPNIEGGAYVSVSDYGKLLLMHLRGGLCGETRALSEEAVERMQVDRILEEYDGTTGVGGMLEGYGLGWWIDRNNPGVFMDPGAYGAVPWLDLPRGYGAFIALESTSGVGAELAALAKPVLDGIFDTR